MGRTFRGGNKNLKLHAHVSRSHCYGPSGRSSLKFANNGKFCTSAPTLEPSSLINQCPCPAFYLTEDRQGRIEGKFEVAYGRAGAVCRLAKVKCGKAVPGAKMLSNR